MPKYKGFTNNKIHILIRIRTLKIFNKKLCLFQRKNNTDLEEMFGGLSRNNEIDYQDFGAIVLEIINMFSHHSCKLGD